MTTTVTSTEFQRNVGKHTQNARREPVIITNHGQPSLALIAAEEYERFKRLNDRVACHPSELSEEMKQALEDSISEMDRQGVTATNHPVVKF